MLSATVHFDARPMIVRAAIGEPTRSLRSFQRMLELNALVPPLRYRLGVITSGDRSQAVMTYTLSDVDELPEVIEHICSEQFTLLLAEPALEDLVRPPISTEEVRKNCAALVHGTVASYRSMIDALPLGLDGDTAAKPELRAAFARLQQATARHLIAVAQALNALAPDGPLESALRSVGLQVEPMLTLLAQMCTSMQRVCAADGLMAVPRDELLELASLERLLAAPDVQAFLQ